MKQILFVASEGVSFDRLAGGFSIFNIIDSVQAETLPLSIPKIFITLIGERDEGDPEGNSHGNFSVYCNATTLSESKVEVHTDGTFRSYLNARLEGLQIPEEGRLVFKYDDPRFRFHAEYSIAVRHRNQESPPSQ